MKLIQTILRLDIGKTAKLCLAIMASHDAKPWIVSELVEIIGGDAKTVRFALRDLVHRGFVKIIGLTELQAKIYVMQPDMILRFVLPDDEKNQSSLARLSRQAQQRRSQHKTKPTL